MENSMKIKSKDLKEGQVKNLVKTLETLGDRSSSGKYLRKKLRDLGFKLQDQETWVKFLKSSELNKYTSPGIEYIRLCWSLGGAVD